MRLAASGEPCLSEGAASCKSHRCLLLKQAQVHLVSALQLAVLRGLLQRLQAGQLSAILGQGYFILQRHGMSWRTPPTCSH